MKLISVRELRASGGAIRRELEREGDLVLTANGRPIAIISSASADTIEEDLAAIRRARADPRSHPRRPPATMRGCADPRGVRARPCAPPARDTWCGHGADARAVFAELREIVEETIRLYEEDGKPLPPPMSGRDFVNAMQSIA